MSSLESYNFRQYRGTTPKAKAVVKREDSARIASPQKRPPGWYSSVDPRALSLDRATHHVCVRACVFAADVCSRVDEDTALLKAFDLDYTYGPAIGMVVNECSPLATYKFTLDSV